MSFGKGALSALGKLGIIIAIAVAFLFGLAGTIWLSFRTSEVQVPDIVGKDFLAAESVLTDAGLNVRKRATRPTADKPNVVLDQLPRPGVVVKVGQTVAVDISRTPKEGEYVPSSTTETKPEAGQQNENQNQNANEASPNKNQNANQNSNNQNQNKRPKNTNKNANNSNNANNGNANRNANNRNAANANNANNRNPNANRNTNAPGNANRPGTNLNANRRAPLPTTTPANPGGNARTP